MNLIEMFERMDFLVPIVNRVHGKNHLEMADVVVIYDGLVKAVADGSDLSSSFVELRKVTSDYLIPGDVCESFEEVYLGLKELDRILG